MDNNTIKYTNKIINYNNYFENNKEKLFSIYKYFYKKLKNVINNTDKNNINKKLQKKIIWSPSDIKTPFLYNNYDDEDYSFSEFKELFNQLKINFSKFSKMDITKYIKNIDDEVINVLNYIHSNRYVSLNIKQWIQCNINVCYKYNFDHLELYYFYSSTYDYNKINNQYKNFNSTNDIVTEIYIITKWIYDINPLYKIKFYFFDTPQKKYLPNDGSLSLKIKNKYKLEEKWLSPMNINAGFTSLGDATKQTSLNYREIFIWRREEVYLVLTHELFHYLLLDTKFLNDEVYDKLFNNKIQPYLLLNESITEIMSNFFYIMYYSIRNGENNLDKDFLKFKEIYVNDLIFSWYQSVKILKYFNINSLEINQLSKIKSHTAVFSYSILRPILTTEFCEILFSFPYIAKIFGNDQNNKECNIKSCETILNYIKNKINILPNKYINEAINNIIIYEDTLRRTLYV
jgi:hypothetical protein